MPKNFIDDYTNALVHDPASEFGSVGNAMSSKNGVRDNVGQLTSSSNDLAAKYAASALAHGEALSPASAGDVAGTVASLDPAARARVLGQASSKNVQTLVEKSLERQAVDPNDDGASQLIRSVANDRGSGPAQTEISANVWRGASAALSNTKIAGALSGDGSRSLRADTLSVYQKAAPAIRSGMDPANPTTASQYRSFLQFGTAARDDISARYDAQMRSDANSLGSKTTLPPMTAADALGKIRPGSDMQYDGNSNVVIQPDADCTASKPEFDKNTTVVFVNGVNTNMSRAVVGAQRLADETGNNVQIIHNATEDLGHDTMTAAKQRLGLYGGAGPADQAVRDTILQRVSTDSKGNLQMKGDLHFVAHSKGAISTANGIDDAKKQLLSEGHSETDVDALFGKHISIETLGGAGAATPKSIKRVDYDNTHDLVPVVGIGPTSGNDYIRTGTALIEPSGGGLTIAEGLLNHFRGAPGSGIDVPVTANHDYDSGNIVDNLFAVNHDAPRYFAYREPFCTSVRSRAASRDESAATSDDDREGQRLPDEWSTSG